VKELSTLYGDAGDPRRDLSRAGCASSVASSPLNVLDSDGLKAVDSWSFLRPAAERGPTWLGTPAAFSRPPGEGYFRLSALNSRRPIVAEAMERIAQSSLARFPIKWRSERESNPLPPWFCRLLRANCPLKQLLAPRAERR